MPKIAAILLAAGLSERMGGPNKMLLEHDGFKLIEHSYGHLVFSEIDKMTVVTGRDNELVAALFPNDKDIIFNHDYESGMTSSIQTGVSHLPEEFAYMICLGDMVWLKKNQYNALINKAKEALIINPKAIVVPRVNGRPGNPVIFSSHYREAILDHKEPNGCKNIVQQNKENLVYLETNHSAYLKDIDTPEDLDGLTL